MADPFVLIKVESAAQVGRILRKPFKWLLNQMLLLRLRLVTNFNFRKMNTKVEGKILVLLSEHLKK